MNRPKNPKSRWKNQYVEVPDQSNFHERVREILCRDEFFRSFSCYQEVPVEDLVPGYGSLHRVDWYIEELGIVIELMGTQHDHPTQFGGGRSFETVQADFHRQRQRDLTKQHALEEAGYQYRAIPYRETGRLDAARLKALLLGTA